MIQNVMFWWVVPAAYTLVRSESRSEAVALSAAALVPLTPLFWPLVWNDFRELQLAGPFVLWAMQGVRSRSAGMAAAGIAGMLACRQEYAVMVATFAFLPPRDPETLSVTLRWRRTLFLIGLLWMFVGFFGYLRFVVRAAARPTPSWISFWAPRPRLARRSRPRSKRCSWEWGPGPFWRAWLLESQFLLCPGSGARAAGSGPCGCCRRPNGTPSVT